MASEVFEFLWRVSGVNYRWLDTRATNAGRDKVARPWLTNAVPLGSPYGGWEYDPLRTTTGLFRTFAQTDPGSEGIQAFANEYGLLGVAESILVPMPKPKVGQTLGWGESLAEWERHIYRMRR